MLFSPRPTEKRSPGAIAISVALHLVIGAVILRAVVGSNGIAEWLIGPQDGAKSEKIELVAVAPPGGDPSGGGAPVSAQVKPTTGFRSSVLVAPTAIPTVVPDAGGGRGGAGGGTGSGFGTGRGSGVSRGIVPGYDPRLYPGAPDAPRIVRTPKERLDSVINERFAEYADSVSNAPSNGGVTEDGRADLTFTRGGKKYGWTQKGIVLGNITLPAPLLALLPLNRLGSNPTSIIRQENPWAIRNQIQAGAQVALNSETFNERVKQIRQRRDRERQAAREPQAPQPVTPTPIQER